jgi:hypothetical protein
MAVTLSLFAGAGAQFFDNNGNVLSGGKIYTYQAGTTTPLATYTTNSESAFHTNPIILDSAGRVPSGGEIWLQLGVGYKFVLRTSTDVLIATYDNIPSSAQPPAANDADSIMYEQGYTVTAGSFVVGKIYRIASVGTTNFTLIGAVNNTVGTHFIATGVGTGTGTAELSQTVETKLRQTVSIKDFGAVGDGVTDDTAAIQALATYLTNVSGAYVIWPAGTYYVARTGAPETVNFEFVGCESMTWEFVGGANISFKADFVHSSSLVSSKIVFRNCKNLSILNIETNGNVSTGTKVGFEQGEHGLNFFGCQDVQLLNAKLHDHPNDGLYIDHTFSGGLISIPSERFFVSNLDTYNNARQGMSVIGLFDSTFVNCTFRDTGNTGGFGSYSPGAGVDIEPNSILELCANNITFINPLIKNNIGPIFISANLASPAYPAIAETGNADNLTIINPNFSTGATSSGSDQVIISLKNASIFGGTTNLTTGTIKTYRITAGFGAYLSHLNMQNHNVIGLDQCFLAILDGTRTVMDQKITVQNCSFVCKSASTNGGDLFIQSNVGGSFIDNTIIVPSAAYSTGSATREVVRLRNLDTVERNIYDTNMVTAGQMFVVDYANTVSVSNETFKSPTYFWALNSNGSPATPLYGRGQTTAGMQLNLFDFRGTSSGDLFSRVFSSFTPPTSNSWLRGDIVLNSQPSDGGNIGWVCTASGTPGTWKTFGVIAV